MDKEEVIKKFNERYSVLHIENIDDKIYSLNHNDKITVSCVKCKHSWPASIKNIFMFQLRCYNCHKGKNYSMDEIKILHYLKDNYLSSPLFFAENGKQLTIYPNKPKNIPGYNPPLFYTCDGYCRKTYKYENEILTTDDKKGTVFEVLGDYYHSNPEYYKSDDISACKGRTHKENYEYSMNRLKHIEEQGYQVYYIWVSDFRKYTRDLEKSKVHLFDYMNIEKKYNTFGDTTLLPKGTLKYVNAAKYNFNCF